MRESFTRVLAVLVALCIGLLPASVQAMLWACDFDGNLYNVNASTAGLTFIGSTGIDNLAALEFSPDGRLWGIKAEYTGSSTLWSIDPTTGASTQVGTGLGFTAVEGALAFSPDGTAYGVEAVSGGIRHLFTADLSTGLGTLGAAFTDVVGADVNGLAWRSDGQLVGLVGATNVNAINELMTIDPLTGSFATISPLGFDAGAVGGMATDPFTGTSYFATGYGGTNSLYSFDLYTGDFSAIGTFSHASLAAYGISGLAATPIPEPGTLMLFGFGLAGGAAALRRKRANRA